MQFIFTNVVAQCPATVTAFVQSKTVATCPSNATLVVGSNANGVASAQYQFTAAPPGISLAAQASNTFTSLLPGFYTVKVTCGNSSATVGLEIQTTYVQLTATTPITNTCVNFTRGGTITVNAANGNPPYTYSLLKTTNANYADNLSVYGTNNIFNTTDSGTFQVRIKDACSNFITKTVVMEPSSPGVAIQPFYPVYDQPCGSGNVSLQFGLKDINNISHGIGDFPSGLKFDIFKKGVGCTRGVFISSQLLPASAPVHLITVPENQSLYIRVTNVCGDTTFACYEAPSTPLEFQTFWNTNQSGCGTAAAPNGYLNIIHSYSVYGKGPLLFSLKTLSGTLVRNPTADSSSFNYLPYGTYVVIGTDACGKVAKDTLYPPAVGLAVAFSSWTNLECTYLTGTTHFRAFIDGFIPDLQHAVVTITAGPTNVGVVGSFVGDLPVIEWFNMVPGNYTASIVTACGNKIVNFSIDPGTPVLTQSLDINANQACNNGGVVYAHLNYNGQGLVYYDLYNNVNVLIASNTSGNFSGIAAGTYVVKSRIVIDGSCAIPAYIISKSVIIYPDGTPPQVTKKIGLVCETASGVTTTTGKAIIREAGFAPFKIELKKINETDINYILVATNTYNSYTITGLIPYENYRVRITDACGNTALTDVAIGQLQQLSATNSLAPCVGAEYILSAPDFIDATYSWKLNGAVISTNRELVFPTYAAANDGIYECTMVIGGGCVTRTFTSILTGSCGLLPIKLESLAAEAKDCKVLIKWDVTQEINASKYLVERSINGTQFEKIGEVFALNNINGGTYTFEDKTPITGAGYYRINMFEKDGTHILSTIVTVKSNCVTNEKRISFYPNPIKNKTVNVAVNSLFGGNVMVNFISITGQVIRKEKIILAVGETHKLFILNEFAKGIYIARVIDESGNEIAIQKLIVD